MRQSNNNKLRANMCVSVLRKGVFNKFFSLEILIIPLLQRSWQCATHTPWYHFNSFFIHTLLYCRILVCVSPSSSWNDVVIVEYSEGREEIIRILLHSALFNCGSHNGVIMRCCVFCFKKNIVRNYTGWHRINRSNLTFVFTPSVSNRADGRTRGSP